VVAGDGAVAGSRAAAHGVITPHYLHSSYASAKRCSVHAGCALYNRARAAFHGTVGGEGNSAGAAPPLSLAAAAGAAAAPSLARAWLFGEADLEAFPINAE
jgi:hypothetical protein